MPSWFLTSKAPGTCPSQGMVLREHEALVVACERQDG